MARKESITKDQLLEVAFELVKDEGIENLTARKLAAKAGCSTQPIFRIYKNMDEVAEEVFEKAMKYYNDYYRNYKKVCGVPFVDLGIAFIAFAQNNKNMYKLLFLSEQRFGHGLYEILNGEYQFVGHDINKARNLGCSNPENLFMEIWIYMYGAANMALIGEYDVIGDNTEEKLIKFYKALS